MTSHYTVYGSETIDTTIRRDLETISTAVQSEFDQHEIRALILGGGYGRGEGGVFLENGQELLFNDYDLFVVVPNCSRRQRNNIFARLQTVRHKLERTIRIEVDFSVPLREREIAILPFYLIWYELKNGYEVFYGDKHILDELKDYNGSDIPIMEGLKLLLNRAAGLLLARQTLENHTILNGDEKEFVFRNIQKAIQAAGDAYLMTRHDYHYFYQERQRRLTKYADDALLQQGDFLELYRRAIEYKLQPYDVDMDIHALQTLLKAVLPLYERLYLHTFGEYFGMRDLEWQQYLDVMLKAGTSGLPLKERLKNLYLNMTLDRLRNPDWRWYAKYPRYRLFYAVPFVVFQIPEISGNLAHVLSSNVVDDYQKRFLELWKRYN